MQTKNNFSTLVACPRCDKKLELLSPNDFHCKACNVDFPNVEGVPWLFAEPQAAFQEWRERLKLATRKLEHDSSRLQQELSDENLHPLTRKRLSRLKQAYDEQVPKLQELLAPFTLQEMQTSLPTYLALRTRLPSDQGLNTYYPNIHRDWAWGKRENDESLELLVAAVGKCGALGKTLVLGAGACRLAYDLHMAMPTDFTVALDFNPLLLLLAQRLMKGEKFNLYEFPIAPKTLEDQAILRTLSAEQPVRDGFHFVLADALRPPFTAGSFDTVITPWLSDIISEEFQQFAPRINNLLVDGGRWINFGSLAFGHPEQSYCYSLEETLAVIENTGFSEPMVNEATIPYMCSPASRHGRRETVLTITSIKNKSTVRPSRYEALPDWIVRGRGPVPLSRSFQMQAASTRIHAFIMSTIDGKRSLQDMARLMEQQRLMTYEEAEPAIRSFLIKMYDDSHKYSAY